jgi:hypothetical protein
MSVRKRTARLSMRALKDRYMQQAIEQPATTATVNPLAYAIEDVPAVTGLTRTRVFEAIRQKQLMARKSGRRTIIEVAELQRFIATLPTRGRQLEVATS